MTDNYSCPYFHHPAKTCESHLLQEYDWQVTKTLKCEIWNTYVKLSMQHRRKCVWRTNPWDKLETVNSKSAVCLRPQSFVSSLFYSTVSVWPWTVCDLETLTFGSENLLHSSPYKFTDDYISERTVKIWKGCTNFLGQRAKFANGQCIEGRKSACTLLGERKQTGRGRCLCSPSHSATPHTHFLHLSHPSPDWTMACYLPTGQEIGHAHTSQMRRYYCFCVCTVVKSSLLATNNSNFLQSSAPLKYGYLMKLQQTLNGSENLLHSSQCIDAEKPWKYITCLSL